MRQCGSLFSWGKPTPVQGYDTIFQFPSVTLTVYHSSPIWSKTLGSCFAYNCACACLCVYSCVCCVTHKLINWCTTSWMKSDVHIVNIWVIRLDNTPILRDKQLSCNQQKNCWRISIKTFNVLQSLSKFVPFINLLRLFNYYLTFIVPKPLCQTKTDRHCMIMVYTCKHL